RGPDPGRGPPPERPGAQGRVRRPAGRDRPAAGGGGARAGGAGAGGRGACRFSRGRAGPGPSEGDRLLHSREGSEDAGRPRGALRGVRRVPGAACAVQGGAGAAVPRPWGSGGGRGVRRARRPAEV
ncbi:unnamed protein product, partial [Prorocentrum cordatum]